MKIVAQTDEEKEIADLMQRCLAQFPLSSETDRIQVVIHGNRTHISYLTEESNRREGTHFDLTLEGTLCDVINLDISKNKRRNGYGRKLYQAIEQFARDIGCTKIQTTPSGEGKHFWPKMGFTSRNEIGLERSIY